MSDKHVESVRNDAFVEIDIVDKHDGFKTISDVLTGKSVKIAH